ncbi:MAG TPA: permease prefix domain 1-containing protein [Bryobacteraceae bacterium]|nr:permease prefix domain 1-containing protein [Bryobacteraceae bacterium]
MHFYASSVTLPIEERGIRGSPEIRPPARHSEQLEKELRFHLDRHESDLLVRGRSPEQAQREARVALGGPEQVKERCRDARGTRWAEELLQDIRYALRGFRQKPGFAVTTMVISALGIGATTVMFTLINGVLLRPLPFSEPSRLVVLHGFLEHLGEFWGYSYPDFQDIHHESRTLTVAGGTFSGGTISAPGEPEYVDGRQISAGLFSTLGISPFYGRSFRPDEDRPGAAPVAMISYGLRRHRFRRGSLGTW